MKAHLAGIILFGFVISGAISSASSGAATMGAPSGDAAAGKAVFKQRCSTCHGANGKGNETLSKALGAHIPAMDSDQVQGKSDDEIKAVITQGKGKMTAIKGLSDEGIANVIAFVRTFKKK
jgi:mono/diheme cytochrome c family protein